MRKYVAFLKVIEHGSFTMAAEELNYTQSAISQMINTLEKDLNVTLFIRSKHGLQLTYEGTQLVPIIRELVKTDNKLKEKCMALNGLQAGIVRIATFATFSGSIFPKILKEFKKDYPNIIFEFHQGYYREIENWVSKDVVDFGITNIDDMKKFQTYKLFDDPLFVALPKDHELTGESQIDVKSLKDEPFIVLDEGDEKDFMNVLRTMSIELDIKYHLCDDNSILAMVENGLGVAILPKLAILAGHFDIVDVPIIPSLTRTIGIIYKNKNIISPQSQIFINYLIEHTKNYPDTELES
ncbi:LysR family transcriptional regulator [Lachnospiraceae bacterium NSJ-143]|nr:LysR family transcriptional regulator [Lachnospiraceae bacterium NSJ-143]